MSRLSTLPKNRYHEIVNNYIDTSAELVSSRAIIIQCGIEPTSHELDRQFEWSLGDRAFLMIQEQNITEAYWPRKSYILMDSVPDRMSQGFQ